MLVKELYGDYNHYVAATGLPDRASIRAHNLLNSNGLKGRGVCRHKALCMAGILNSIGIPASYERGKLSSGGYHAWVILKDRNLLVDPTWNHFSDPSTYYQKYGVTDRGEIKDRSQTEF